MSREYTREQYLERIALIKAAKNRQISITTDVIVGFPGETEAEFEETLSLLDEVGYDSIFSFKYSARPNTPALKYRGRYSGGRKMAPVAKLERKAARNTNYSISQSFR